MPVLLIHQVSSYSSPMETQESVPLVKRVIAPLRRSMPRTAGRLSLIAPGSCAGHHPLTLAGGRVSNGPRTDSSDLVSRLDLKITAIAKHGLGPYGLDPLPISAVLWLCASVS